MRCFLLSGFSQEVNGGFFWADTACCKGGFSICLPGIDEVLRVLYDVDTDRTMTSSLALDWCLLSRCYGTVLLYYTSV